MEIELMLDPMFDRDLTDAEIKAIVKARGFPIAGAPSRSAVKNLFLSSVGLDEVLPSLTIEEVATLHMLADLEEPADVTFFERLYHAPDFAFERAYLLTFGQRYKEVFKEVRERLVRKGVLLMANEREHGGARLEYWIFAVPQPVLDRLPPVVRPVRLESGPVYQEINTTATRQKLMEIVGEKQDNPLADNPDYRLKVVKGSIVAGKQQTQRLHLGLWWQWQANCWIRSVPTKVRSSVEADHPALAVIEALQKMEPGDWFLARQVEPLLKVHCFGVDIPAVEAILEEGWKWGLLARRAQDKKIYYSPVLPVNMMGKAQLRLPEPESYIQQKNNKAWVDLKTVPPEAVVELNQVALLEPDGKRLFITPDIQLAANAFLSLKEMPLAGWLESHVPEFGKGMAYVREQWGKTILHKNVYMARITDFSLMIQIERTFRPGKDFVRLAPDWVVFHKNLLPEVEKLLKKSNFVIKRVTS